MTLTLSLLAIIFAVILRSKPQDAEDNFDRDW